MLGMEWLRSKLVCFKRILSSLNHWRSIIHPIAMDLIGQSIRMRRISWVAYVQAESSDSVRSQYGERAESAGMCEFVA